MTLDDHPSSPITTTAQRAGLNPLAYLGAYLHAYAQAGGKPPTGTALDRFLPWALNPDDRAAWARHPDTTEPDAKRRRPPERVRARRLTRRPLPPSTSTRGLTP